MTSPAWWDQATKPQAIGPLLMAPVQGIDAPVVKDVLAADFLRIGLQDGGELTIASGLIAVSGTKHSIDTESDAATDNLAGAYGGSEGRLLFIKPADDARTIVVKHDDVAEGLDGTRFWMTDNADVSLDDLDDGILFIWQGDLDSATGGWQEIARGGGLVSGAGLTGTPGGELGGTWANPTVDATHSGSAHHAAVTLGAGSDAALALAGQELTLADVLTPAEHTAIGNGAPHHAQAHNVFSADHGDTTGAANPVDGDVIIGNATPKWSKLAISIPGGAGLLNVLGIVTGELRASWKALFDATHPESIGTATEGTATTAAHRDHVHAAVAANITGTADTVLYVDHAGAVKELALGADGTVLTSTGAATAPAFEAAAGGGAVATDAIWDAKGDLAGGTGANTAARLAVGADDTMLMADAAAATGLKWVASAAGGNIDGVQAAAVGTADTFARSDHAHRIQHGIADNAIVTVDDAAVADDDFARWTANGLEGLSVALTKAALLLPVYEEVTITIPVPAAADDFTIRTFDAATTLSEISSVIVAGTNVVFNLYHGTDRSAAGTKALTADVTETSKTTGTVTGGASWADATVDAGAHLRLKVVSVSGAVTELSVTVRYALT